MPIRTLLLAASLFVFPSIALADIAPPPDAAIDGGDAGTGGGCATAPGRSPFAAWVLLTSVAVGLAARRR
jgi:hypothetical protein